MKSKIFNLHQGKLNTTTDDLTTIDPQLLLVFGERNKIEDKKFVEELKVYFPNADIVCGTTSGEIYQQQVCDDTVVVAALSFDKTELAYSIANIDSFGSSFELGKHAAENLQKEGLKYVMVMSDGNKINGTELTKSLTETLERGLRPHRASVEQSG